MPTNFPTSVDNFTNPTANDSLNLPSHSTQHANANDAIEAIEGFLLNTYQPTFRNGVINGSMNIWQRGASVVPTNTQPYSADRWESFRSAFAAGLTVTRQSGIAGVATYSARVQRNSGNTSTAAISFGQAFTFANSNKYVGQTVTLSFYARAGNNFSSASSLLEADIVSGTGIDENIRGAFTGGVTVAESSLALTSSWQRFSITGTVSGSATQLGVRFGYFPVGTAGTDDWFEITGVQLETGAATTLFEELPLETDLALCQSYYLFGGAGAVGRAVTSTLADFNLSLPVQMRVAPTLTFVNNFGILEVNVAGRTATNAALSSATINSVNFSATTTGLTLPNMVFVTANGIGLSAEL